jgi:hypothetical protein
MLAQRDVTTRRRVPVTRPARTLLEIAPRLTEARRRRLYNDALHSRLLRAAQMRELVERLATHPGARLLAPLTARVSGPTRSELEDAFVAFVERFGFPTPQINVVVGGYLVDAYFPDQRLIVELDSAEFHADRHAFERDRERDADGLMADRRTLRITWERLTRRPDREAARLWRILAR